MTALLDLRLPQPPRRGSTRLESTHAAQQYTRHATRPPPFVCCRLSAQSLLPRVSSPWPPCHVHFRQPRVQHSTITHSHVRTPRPRVCLTAGTISSTACWTACSNSRPRPAPPLLHRHHPNYRLRPGHQRMALWSRRLSRRSSPRPTGRPSKPSPLVPSSIQPRRARAAAVRVLGVTTCLPPGVSRCAVLVCLRMRRLLQIVMSMF